MATNNGNVAMTVTVNQPATMPPSLPIEGYVTLTDYDLDTLADYEEEAQRKGHFELLFPLSKNID